MGGPGNDTIGVLDGISSGDVAASYATGRAQTWRNRPLTKPYAYLWLDAKVVKVAGAVKRPSFVVAALGATANGEQEICTIHSI